nr:MAG TPA: hypothetical protein [Bacteriophage sp.]DAH37749.1 MAG TPA: hypothetical protein [Caudoviricetes sp.]
MPVLFCSFWFIKVIPCYYPFIELLYCIYAFIYTKSSFTKRITYSSSFCFFRSIVSIIIYSISYYSLRVGLLPYFPILFKICIYGDTKGSRFI